MPSRVKKLTGRSMERRLNAGRGQGEGAEYTPWLYVTDVPSRGTSVVITGWDGREHHLLSHGERNYFFCLEWADSVVDIREQYPLLPLASTERIAACLRVRHPQVKGESVLMTTDFMLTVQNGSDLQYIARTFKRWADLSSKRTFEKLEIERRHYEERGIDRGIVTDHDIPEAVWRNVRWLHECRDIRKLLPLKPCEIRLISEFMSARIYPHRAITLASFCLACDRSLGIQPGISLKVARFLLANKAWAIDIHSRIETHRPLPVVVVEVIGLWESN